MNEPDAEPWGGGRRRPRPSTTTSGMLLAAAAAPVAVLEGSAGSLGDVGVLPLAIAWLDALLLLIAGLTIVRRPAIGRTAATVAIAGLFGLGSAHLVHAPLETLAALVAATVGLTLLWKIGSPLIGLSRPRRRPVYEGQAQGAAAMSLALWFLWALADREWSVVDAAALGWAMVVSVALGFEWSLREWRRHPGWVALLGAIAVAATVLASLSWGQWWWVMSSYTGFCGAAALLIRPTTHREVEEATWWEPLLGHPERLLVGTFAGLCVGGAVLLALPSNSTTGQSFGFIDAAFTSTSAVCVTGLAVLDTPVDLTLSGQAILLLLIQIGGLGIMTFSTAALWALGKRMSLRHEGAVATLLSTQDRGTMFATAQRILAFTAISEACGAALLTVAFARSGDAPVTALWRGVFTSISAFCNAGFALQSASLVPYQQAPLVLHVVALLIVLGGISPMAVLALPALARRSTRPPPLQAKLGLAATAVLLVAGTVFILAVEWNDSLGSLSVIDRVHNAWFQSVTLRTAGFNSIDLSALRPATVTLMLVWMFIGGSPGGTAGGIKTTTAAVLGLSVVHAIRGQPAVEVFGRRISERTRAKAAVIVTVGAATAVVALLAIQLTQRMPTRMAVFEVISALGTVGLTIGGTAELDGIGKAIIIVCMFVGRVGGLTLLMFLSSRRAPPAMGRPEEEVDVG